MPQFIHMKIDGIHASGLVLGETNENYIALFNDNGHPVRVEVSKNDPGIRAVNETRGDYPTAHATA